MRIIGGTRKGQRIFAPSGDTTRPTTDRVREALFNVLAHNYVNFDSARILDLFAGSGALGLEALSRGGASALFVDDAPGPRAAIRRNLEALKFIGEGKIFRRDATKLGSAPSDLAGRFDLVFCDPPYRKGLGHKALEAAATGGWLAPGAIAVLERAGEETDAPPQGFTLCEARKYGDTQLLILELGEKTD